MKHNIVFAQKIQAVLDEIVNHSKNPDNISVSPVIGVYLMKAIGSLIGDPDHAKRKVRVANEGLIEDIGEERAQRIVNMVNEALDDDGGDWLN